MPTNKDGLVMAVGVIDWRWFVLSVGLFSLLCNIGEGKHVIYKVDLGFWQTYEETTGLFRIFSLNKVFREMHHSDLYRELL